MIDDLTRLSYWFPKLEAAGLPVPRTILVKATDEELEDLYNLLDGKEPEGISDAFIMRLQDAVMKIGTPCFLRTDHTSAKHEWEKTCYLPHADHDTIECHVARIIEFWECVNMFAPACDIWAVREFLPTLPVGVCRGYGNMPICREFRFFVREGKIRCWHPYWPLKALEQGKAEYIEAFDYEAFCKLDLQICQLAVEAGKAVSGDWSIDLLETQKGWFVTDMAEADKSFHWEGCEAVTKGTQ
jgi:hypothetical protein